MNVIAIVRIIVSWFCFFVCVNSFLFFFSLLFPMNKNVARVRVTRKHVECYRNTKNVCVCVCVCHGQLIGLASVCVHLGRGEGEGRSAHLAAGRASMLARRSRNSTQAELY